MSEKEAKDIWDKLSSLSALVASVLVPIVIAIVGNSYTSAIKEAENRVKYIELAISILKEDPDKDKQDVRAWAVDVINQYSGVPMSATVKQQLIGNKLVRSNFEKSDFHESNFTGSNFRNALFREAIFSGSDFRGADLSGIIVDDSTRLPNK